MKTTKVDLTDQARQNLWHWINNLDGKKNLSDKTGISEPTISRFFDESLISQESIRKVCAAFGITEKEFLHSFLFKDENISKALFDRYYAYFFVQEDSTLIHEAIMDLNKNDNSIEFTIKAMNTDTEINLIGEFEKISIL